MRRRATVLAALACSLVAVPAAHATGSFDVAGFADSANALPCTQVQPTVYSCPTLRRAVLEANQDAETDVITLHGGGPYQLTSGQLVVSAGVSIIGEGARSTTVDAGGAGRAFALDGNANVQLANLTIRGGSAGTGKGGNLLINPGSTVSLLLARVTGGSAGSGGGIANGGTLSVQNSLIDNNQATATGGGILNDGSVGVAPSLSVIASTIAANTASGGGSGIQSSGNAANVVQLLGSTVARNGSGGVSLDRQQSASTYGSLFAGNGSSTCSGALFSSAQASVEDANTCALGDGNRFNVDPGVAAALSDQGGPTDVLTIPATGPAVDFVVPCLYPIDQRTFSRVTSSEQPCDAGAYEASAVATSQPPPVPTPAPPAPPAPTPVPTAVPTATPVPAGSVGATEVKGTVLVRDPRTKAFVAFDEALLKGGAEIDARKGTIEITTPAGEKAEFYDGIFKLSQSNGLTTLTLSQPLDCKAKASASAPVKKARTRKLWGEGKGRFRTKGSYSAATVRGTKWLVADTCTTTTTTVAEGAVTVDDFVAKRKTVLRKGKRYVARARRR